MRALVNFFSYKAPLHFCISYSHFCRSSWVGPVPPLFDPSLIVARSLSTFIASTVSSYEHRPGLKLHEPVLAQLAWNDSDRLDEGIGLNALNTWCLLICHQSSQVFKNFRFTSFG